MTILPHMPVPLSSFSLREDVHCRTGTVGKTKVNQFVISSSLVETTLKLLHDTPSAGHPGRDKTLSMAHAKYYWPTLRLDIERHIARCLSCAETKGTTNSPNFGISSTRRTVRRCTHRPSSAATQTPRITICPCVRRPLE